MDVNVCVLGKTAVPDRVKMKFPMKKAVRQLPGQLFSASFSLGISTKMMSSPICLTSQKGITYSFSRPKIPQRHPGPGIIRCVMHPVHSSNSISPTYPSRLQSQILITSFFLSQKYACDHRPKYPFSILCTETGNGSF